MVHKSEKKGFTLYMENGVLRARPTNKSTVFMLHEKMLGFSRVQDTLKKIYHLIYNEYPEKVTLVSVENIADSYSHTYPVAIATNDAKEYLSAKCQYNSSYYKYYY